jgi:hypothetical protein
MSSLSLPFSLSVLQVIAFRGLVVAFFAGAGAVGASFLSSLASSQASDIIQREASKEIATAKTDQERLKENTAKLELALESERMMRVQLQKEIAWRGVNVAQYQTLVGILSSHRMTVNLLAVSGDPESILFGDDIRRTLVSAGFTVNAELRIFTGPIHGLGLSKNPPENRAILADAFNKAGIDFGDDAKTTGDTLTIVVGSKMPVDPKLLPVIPP